MEQEHKLITAEMLDRLSPNERAAAFNARVIFDLDQLPPHFRAEVVRNAERLFEEVRRSTDR